MIMMEQYIQWLMEEPHLYLRGLVRIWLLTIYVSEDKTKTTDIRRIKFCSLTSSSGLLTGISNDIGFENIFKEQLKIF